MTKASIVKHDKGRDNLVIQIDSKEQMDNVFNSVCEYNNGRPPKGMSIRREMSENYDMHKGPTKENPVHLHVRLTT